MSLLPGAGSCQIYTFILINLFNNYQKYSDLALLLNKNVPFLTIRTTTIKIQSSANLELGKTNMYNYKRVMNMTLN